MNKWLFTIAFLLIGSQAFSQSIFIDIKQNWYCEVPRLELDMIDTMVLTPQAPKPDATRPLFLWQYAGNKIYQILVLRMATTGDKPEYPPEKWKIVQTGPNDYRLTVKDTYPSKLIHKRIRKYKLIQVRDNYQILKKVILVRE